MRCLNCGAWTNESHTWDDGLWYVGVRCPTHARMAAEVAYAQLLTRCLQLVRYADATGDDSARARASYLRRLYVDTDVPLAGPWAGENAFRAWSAANPPPNPVRPPTGPPAAPVAPAGIPDRPPLRRRRRLRPPSPGG